MTSIRSETRHYLAPIAVVLILLGLVPLACGYGASVMYPENEARHTHPRAD